jgi:2-methylcitrate dehydratase PrpD
MAGLLAQKGADGPERIFEGEKGFFRAFAGKACDSEAICENLGKEFKISSVYFKKHAACRHIHPALDAISEIVARDKPAIDEIKSIAVDTYTIANNLTGHLATEGSELAAKFSMPVAIGLMLVFGQSDASAFNRQYLSDPRVQSIARKVAISVNPDRDAKYPKQREACVTVHTENQSYTHEVAYPKGEPENPLSDQEFRDKYEMNALQLYPKSRVMKLRDAVLNIENIDVRDMVKFLKAPSAK